MGSSAATKIVRRSDPIRPSSLELIKAPASRRWSAEHLAAALRAPETFSRRCVGCLPFGLPVLALLALLPAKGRGSPPELSRETPPVLLEKMTVAADGATAPLAAGGTAALTIDPALQRAADRLLAAARPVGGTVVMLHAPSGRVLVFDQYSRQRDTGRLLYEARSPSASVFKIVTSAALLETGRIDPQTEVCFAGGNHSIERRHLDPPRAGKVNCAPFGTALGHSRNAVFAQLVTRHLGRDDLIDIAARFGFNKLLPFDYPVPLGNLKVPYNDLEFARAAAGFEGSTLSPLGAAYLGYVVAAGGQAPRLRVLKNPAGASTSSRVSSCEAACFARGRLRSSRG